MTRPPRSPEQQHLVETLLDAYRSGAFPMADGPRGPIHLCTTPRRGVLPLDALHVPRSLARRLRSGWFHLTADTAFSKLVALCARPRKGETRDSIWINHELHALYTLLHEAGHAHSIEAWRTDPDTNTTVLAGGIFGVAIGAAFCAESMASTPKPRTPDNQRHPLDGADAGKTALVALVHHLRDCGFTLLDTQLANPHIERLGVIEITDDQYEHQLRAALTHPDRWRPFEPRSCADLPPTGSG